MKSKLVVKIKKKWWNHQHCCDFSVPFSAPTCCQSSMHVVPRFCVVIFSRSYEPRLLTLMMQYTYPMWWLAFMNKWTVLYLVRQSIAPPHNNLKKLVLLLVTLSYLMMHYRLRKNSPLCCHVGCVLTYSVIKVVIITIVAIKRCKVCNKSFYEVMKLTYVFYKLPMNCFLIASSSQYWLTGAVHSRRWITRQV